MKVTVPVNIDVNVFNAETEGARILAKKAVQKYLESWPHRFRFVDDLNEWVVESNIIADGLFSRLLADDGSVRSPRERMQLILEAK